MRPRSFRAGRSVAAVACACSARACSRSPGALRCARPGRSVASPRRANRNPTSAGRAAMTAEVVGRINLVQEDRFLLVDARGRGFLFTLDKRAGCGAADLERWCAEGVTVGVRYWGDPNTRAIAARVLALTDG